MSSPHPTIVLIPGIWVGPKIYDLVSSTLQTHHYPTTTVTLPSTGRPSPGNPSMHDDESFIRSKLSTLIETEQKDVLIVMHSAGGFLGTAAVKELSKKVRSEKGLRGGVVGYVFLSAAVVEVGHVHVDLPLFDNETGEMHCVDPEKTLFNDMDEESTLKWMKELRCQPAKDWGLTTEYAGFKDAPSVYLICEKDQAVPLEWQTKIAELAGSRIERCAAGHMPMLSMPDKVVEVIIGAAKEFGLSPSPP
ncbi:alpha/beta-hydrolase [Cadophora sp. DSE1049]|nr:alpha/beta-hydrolase [Cadophora sp. DSE1049]